MDKRPEDFSLIRKDAPIALDTEKLGDFMKDKIIKK
jgi:hypothetical protein